MPTTALHSEIQDNPAGVPTRSRRRLRDGADSSSPAGDLLDRSRYKPYTPSRRSPRHAAAAASTAEKLKSPARHPEFATETPSTSRSTSLSDEDLEAASSLTPSISRDEKDATYEKSSDHPISAGAHSASSLPPQHVDIIDLTVPDAQTGQKRKRSTEDDAEVGDDEDQKDSSLQRVTRSIAKRARLNGHTDILVPGLPPLTRVSRSIPAQRAHEQRLEHRRRTRSRLVATEALLIVNKQLASIQGLSFPEGNEALAIEEDPQPQEVHSPHLAQLVHEHPEDSSLDDTLPTSRNGVQALLASLDDKHPTSESVQALPPCDEAEQALPCNSTHGNDEAHRTFTQDNVDPNIANGFEEPNTEMGLQLDGMDIDAAVLSADGYELDGMDIDAAVLSPDGYELDGMDINAAVLSADGYGELDGMDYLDSATPLVGGFGEPKIEMGRLQLDGSDALVSMPPAGGSEAHNIEVLPLDETGAPKLAMPAESFSVDGFLDRPRYPRYCGADGSLLRSQTKPSSRLGPNPVRREPRNSNNALDKGKYLRYAAERAALVTYAQIGRQFPRWFQNPSHVYFRHGDYFRRGLPITDEDIALMKEEEDEDDAFVRVDTDTLLPSSSGQDLFFQPQTELYPSTSSYTTPPMALDDDLDPSLLDGNDFLTQLGPPLDSQPLDSQPLDSQPLDSQLLDSQPQEQFWPPDDMPCWQMDGPYTGSPIAGASNGSTSCFEASGSDMPSGNASQGLPCDPAWLKSTQYSLFEFPPLSFDSKYVSLDSSLSAMASYFVDSTSPRASLDTTMLNIIDGAPPVEVPSPSQSPEHPPVHQMDSNGMDDGHGQQDSPLN